MTAAFRYYPDRDSLMAAAADQFVRLAAAAIGARGRFTVALSGGSTPKGMYRLLGAEPRSAQVDWSKINVFWGDERCVPPDDPASNYRLAREALLDLVPIPSQNIFRMLGEAPPERAAEEYERILRSELPANGAAGRFDLILLGMGDNGHTASLFPGLPAVRERLRWVMAEYVEEVSMWRLTLTPVVINAAANVSFLVSGEDKAEMLARVIEGPVDVDRLPAQVVRPVNGQLRWLVDEPAARRLQHDDRFAEIEQRVGRGGDATS